MVLSGVPRKKSPVTPPRIDPWTVRLVAQCLNHYATPGPRKWQSVISKTQRTFHVFLVRRVQNHVWLYEIQSLCLIFHSTRPEMLYHRLCQINQLALNNCGPLSASHKNYCMRTANVIVFPLWGNMTSRTVWIKFSLKSLRLLSWIRNAPPYFWHPIVQCRLREIYPQSQ